MLGMRFIFTIFVYNFFQEANNICGQSIQEVLKCFDRSSYA